MARWKMSDHLGVVLLPNGSSMEHERAIYRLLGETLAKMLDCPFLGVYDPERHGKGKYYFLPEETLVGHASALHIQEPDDLFGGVVERSFIATKAISHPLASGYRCAPEGWSGQFAEHVAKVTLPGYSVFDLEDARRAGHLMLSNNGLLRLKQVRGKAGRGQQVVRDLDELDEVLGQQDENEVQRWGLVLEENLHQPETFSVGQVSVAGITLSYYGIQHLTHDNNGLQVYGGSELTIVRGDYPALMALCIPGPARLAVQQAQIYEQAAFEAYPGIYASRRNYDVASGVNAGGQQRSGVLEQSWRVGGASAAEIFALQAFMATPSLRQLNASTHECYGDSPAPPDAICLYRGAETDTGLISKYVKVTQA